MPVVLAPKKRPQCIGSTDLRGNPLDPSEAKKTWRVRRCSRRAQVGSTLCVRCAGIDLSSDEADPENHDELCDYVQGAGPCDCWQAR